MKSFKITSGVIVASDPCYEIPTWCQGIIENVKNGEWVATVETDPSSGRIAVLMISHKDVNLELSDMFVDEEEFTFDGGVDSGQFGFFDKDAYRKDELVKDLTKSDFGEGYDEKSGDTWYRAVCALTLGSESWGVLPDGVASSSGWGDGSYTVYGVKDTRSPQLEWVGLRVVFIGSNEDDEFEDDEFEDDEF